MIRYKKLNEIDANELVALLNRERLRKHLVGHQLFDMNGVKIWVESKTKIDLIEGCRVRAIELDEILVGWCGIQLESEKYEIAIVIDERYWGLGKEVFSALMSWAKDFGHSEVYLHLLETRPEYRFLRKIAKNVYTCEIMNRKFTTYCLAVA